MHPQRVKTILILIVCNAVGTSMRRVRRTAQYGPYLRGPENFFGASPANNFFADMSHMGFPPPAPYQPAKQKNTMPNHYPYHGPLYHPQPQVAPYSQYSDPSAPQTNLRGFQQQVHQPFFPSNIDPYAQIQSNEDTSKPPKTTSSTKRPSSTEALTQTTTLQPGGNPYLNSHYAPNAPNSSPNNPTYSDFKLQPALSHSDTLLLPPLIHHQKKTMQQNPTVATKDSEDDRINQRKVNQLSYIKPFVPKVTPFVHIPKAPTPDLGRKGEYIQEIDFQIARPFLAQHSQPIKSSRLTNSFNLPAKENVMLPFDVYNKPPSFQSLLSSIDQHIGTQNKNIIPSLGQQQNYKEPFLVHSKINNKPSKEDEDTKSKEDEENKSKKKSYETDKTEIPMSNLKPAKIEINTLPHFIGEERIKDGNIKNVLPNNQRKGKHSTENAENHILTMNSNMPQSGGDSVIKRPKQSVKPTGHTNIPNVGMSKFTIPAYNNLYQNTNIKSQNADLVYNNFQPTGINTQENILNFQPIYDDNKKGVSQMQPHQNQAFIPQKNPAEPFPQRGNENLKRYTYSLVPKPLSPHKPIANPTIDPLTIQQKNVPNAKPVAPAQNIPETHNDLTISQLTSNPQHATVGFGGPLGFRQSFNSEVPRSPVAHPKYMLDKTVVNSENDVLIEKQNNSNGPETNPLSNNGLKTNSDLTQSQFSSLPYHGIVRQQTPQQSSFVPPFNLNLPGNSAPHQREFSSFPVQSTISNSLEQNTVKHNEQLQYTPSGSFRSPLQHHSSAQTPQTPKFPGNFEQNQQQRVFYPQETKKELQPPQLSHQQDFFTNSLTNIEELKKSFEPSPSLSPQSKDVQLQIVDSTYSESLRNILDVKKDISYSQNIPPHTFGNGNNFIGPQMPNFASTKKLPTELGTQEKIPKMDTSSDKNERKEHTGKTNGIAKPMIGPSLPPVSPNEEDKSGRNSAQSLAPSSVDVQPSFPGIKVQDINTLVRTTKRPQTQHKINKKAQVTTTTEKINKVSKQKMFIPSKNIKETKHETNKVKIAQVKKSKSKTDKNKIVPDRSTRRKFPLTKKLRKEDALNNLLAIAGGNWMGDKNDEKKAKVKDFSCPKSEGYFSDPTGKCSVYYRCVHGKSSQMQCGDGLSWNKESQQCDWGDNVKCEVPRA